MSQEYWYNSLRVLIVTLLTLALFPLGAVAVYQTDQVARKAERNAELALLSITADAAKAEELLIERAFGAARVFATVAEEYIADPPSCTEDFGRFVENDPRYSFIGVLPISGQMTCSSSGVDYDFSAFPGFAERVQDQSPSIEVNTSAPLSATSVFIVSEPYEVGGEFAGFVSISIPHTRLPDTPDSFTALGLEELITLNRDGEVLTARSALDAAVLELPTEADLKRVLTASNTAFQSVNQAGAPRRYTVVPIQGSPALVLGVWRTDAGLAREVVGTVRPWLFPVLMWFASMGVAMLSIYMLVLRHLTKLRMRMNAFASDRTIKVSEDLGPVPNEISDLYGHFERMTDTVLREEAALEDNLREKNVLIKEVHHRVKNNLQLISSIMNMQIRTAKHEETRSVLSRLQDRVLSLATIHRDLYQSDQGGMVNVGNLVSEIVENSLEVAISSYRAIDMETDIDPVLLFPDQAVPLSLLTAEAVTNVMKYVGNKKGQRPAVNVSLKQDGAACTLTISNTLGASETVESTGLGAQLMNAFAIQLGGQMENEVLPDRYTTTIRFTIADFVQDARDY
ncbi:sensor histidine kinase [uncultured Tateyamaria sp.]|uniref:sensor histidine kinase n=1 Tax=uncultured Tateyamaria sp. TaxID=455651 RepID=UPI002608575B|nr:sensor histidine kinase [uncultured Tateyamaria sp.]